MRIVTSRQKTTAFFQELKTCLNKFSFAKKDEVRETIAYGRLISALTAAQAAGAWRPRSPRRGVGSGFERGAVILAADLR